MEVHQDQVVIPRRGVLHFLQGNLSIFRRVNHKAQFFQQFRLNFPVNLVVLHQQDFLYRQRMPPAFTHDKARRRQGPEAEIRGKDTALAHHALDFNGAAHHIHDAFGNAQTQPDAVDAAEGGILLPAERLEGPGQKFLTDADARVPNHKLEDHILIRQFLHFPETDFHRAPGVGIGDGVVGQIHHKLLELLLVGEHGAVSDLHAVQGKINVLLLGLGKQKVVNLPDDAAKVAFHLPQAVAVGEGGHLQHLVNHIQKPMPRGFNLFQILIDGVVLFQIQLCKRGKAEDGIQWRSHIVGHIGQEGILCRHSQICLFQRVGQELFLLQLLLYFLIHPPIAKDHLRRVGPMPRVHQPQLQILGQALHHGAVIEVVRAALFELLPNIIRRRSPSHYLPVLRMHPGLYVGVRKPGVFLFLEALFKQRRGPFAHPVGLYDILFKVHIADGIVIHAEALDNLQPPLLLLPGQIPLLVIGQSEGFQFFLILPPLVQQGGFFGENLFPFFGGVADEDIENASHRHRVHIVSVILNPAHLPILSLNAVLHIIQIAPAPGDLLLNAGFHPFQVVGMHQATKRIPCPRPELRHGPALEYLKQGAVGVDDLFPGVRAVDQEAAGHFVHKLDPLPGRLQIFRHILRHLQRPVPVQLVYLYAPGLKQAKQAQYILYQMPLLFFHERLPPSLSLYSVP